MFHSLLRMPLNADRLEISEVDSSAALRVKRSRAMKHSLRFYYSSLNYHVEYMTKWLLRSLLSV